MIIRRRSFLKAASCLPLSLALPSIAYTKIDFGMTKVTTVSDGSITLPAGLTFDTMPQAELELIINELSLSREQLVRECNVTLLETENRKILFDVGAGVYFLDGMGAIVDSLDERGLTPEDITDVIFTHAHPDHIWGVLDDFDDLLFPNATYHIGRTEWDYWWNPETVNRVDESRVETAVGAKTRFEALQDQIEFFDDGDEPIPGVRALMTPGLATSPGWSRRWAGGTASRERVVVGPVGPSGPPPQAAASTLAVTSPAILGCLVREAMGGRRVYRPRARSACPIGFSPPGAPSARGPPAPRAPAGAARSA